MRYLKVFFLILLCHLVFSKVSAAPSPEELFPVSYGNRWGFIDSAGTLTIPMIYDASHGGFKEGLAAVQFGHQWGFVDSEGKTVIPFQFEDAQSFSGGLATVEMAEKYGCINHRGKWVIQARYDWVGPFENGLAAFNLGDKCGYLDRTGHVAISAHFDDADDFSPDGLARVETKDGVGFIGRDGRYVISPRQVSFDDAGGFHEGLAPAKKNGRFGFIDRKGSWVIQPQYLGNGEFREHLAAVKDGKTWGFVDRTGRMVIPANLSRAGAFSEGLAFFRKGSRAGYLDASGKTFLTLPVREGHLFSNGLAEVNFGGAWGYVDKTGKRIWDPFAMALKGTLDWEWVNIRFGGWVILAAYSLSLWWVRKIKAAPEEARAALLHKMARQIGFLRMIFLAGFFYFLYFSNQNGMDDIGVMVRCVLSMAHLPLSGGLTFLVMFLFLIIPFLLTNPLLSMTMYQADKIVRKTTWTFWESFRFRIQGLALVFSPITVWFFLRCETSIPQAAQNALFVLFLIGLYALNPLIWRFTRKCEPLEKGELADALRGLSEKSGVKITGLWILRFGGANVANAWVTGIFPFCRYIFLSDFLVGHFSVNEIEAILAHEIGHIKKRHLWVYLGSALVFFGLSGWWMDGINKSRLFPGQLVPFINVLWLVWFLFYGLLILPWIRRRTERQADRYAVELTGQPELLAESLQKLTQINYMQKKWGRFGGIFKTHPDLVNRLREIREKYGGAPEKA